ncbi:multidrug efflux MFS transporter EmrD [Photobacterium galatheae]|uniref:Bcr/CflA family efflux transporter n=1 Tax=Photobacterium galatheae TaxID=1654360 RepID=A0A066RR11_9GAMM|nr:multidrug efflux MFS transporter EmrD [Photobacterium galatheae]KDM91556.1 major facilitator transporter [Photobacterium galatheae]MCM0149629.1 multidrug efflux MFS transporter EmrD [Photobacterium galatheae]
MAKILFLIIILAAVGQMTQTMYVPAIPQMAAAFTVKPAFLQAVMAAYLIPYGLSQFVYGPLSDRIGRKPVMLAGMSIFIAGTILALFAPSFEMFLLASFIQGMGTGCGGAMCRTVTRDCYEGAELHRVNSLVSMGVIFSPLIAPVLGGYLSESFGWSASYLFLLVLGAAVTLIVLSQFTETLPKEKRRVERVTTSYKYVLGNRKFQGYVVCLVATFAGLAVFEAAAGVLLGNVLKLDPTTVSWLFVLPLPGYMLGSWLSAQLVQRMGQQRVLYLGLAALGFGALTILLPGLAGMVTVSSLIGGAFMYFIGAGIIFPVTTTAAIEPFPYHAGTAGAVLGGLQNLGAGLATLVASMLSAKDQFSLGAIMVAMVMLAVASLIWVRRTPQEETPVLV